MAVTVRLDDHSDEIIDILRETKLAALEECGLVAEGFAKRLCPVDTGNLRNSITHTVSGETAYIGTNVEYAAYVEMGTTRTVAKPYLKPAVADNADVYKQILYNYMGE